MDKQTRDVMIGIDVFLWAFFAIRCLIWGCEIVNAYQYGGNYGGGFNGVSTFYIGWDAVRMECELIIEWTGGFWLLYFLFIMAYTIYMIIRFRKCNDDWK